MFDLFFFFVKNGLFLLTYIQKYNSQFVFTQVYSDADIVLSADWVPPVCLPRAEPPLSAPPLGENERAPRKSAAAVSFSLDGSTPKDDASKPDKKNKVITKTCILIYWLLLHKVLF